MNPMDNPWKIAFIGAYREMVERREGAAEKMLRTTEDRDIGAWQAYALTCEVLNQIVQYCEGAEKANDAQTELVEAIQRAKNECTN